MSGYQCQCLPGYTLVTNTSCADINECDMSPCSHLCSNTPGSYSCSCHPRYTLHDTSLCSVSQGEVRLLVTHHSNLNIVNLVNSSDDDINIVKSSDHDINIVKIQDLDTLQSAGLVYWIQDDGLYRAKINDSDDDDDELVRDDVGVDDHLAVDWVHSILFLAQKNKISVMRYDGEYKRDIISRDTLITSIRVHPGRAVIVWTEDGRVMSAGMDGEHVNTLVNASQPRDLAIDHIQERVYYVEAEYNSIRDIDLSGGNQRTVLKENDEIEKLAVFEDWVYYTVKMNTISQIYRAHKRDGSNKQRLGEFSDDISSIQPLHSLYQPSSSSNICQKSSCSHLCVPQYVPHHLETQDLLSHVCLCPDNVNLDKDNSTCVTNISKLVTSNSKHVEEKLEDLKKTKETDNLIMMLIFGVLIGSIIIVVLVKLVTIHNEVFKNFLL